MTLGAGTPNVGRRPWAFAAVSVMVLALTLLLFGLSWDSVIQLLPGYIAAYLLIGACIFGPGRRRDSLKIRKALLAGAVALTLTGAGVAIGWAADPPSPSPSSSAPEQENRPAKPDKSQRPQHLHSEGVVKKEDGSFQVVLEQRGTVEAVSDTSITVKSEDGYSRTYTVNAETKIRQAPSARRDSPPEKDDGGKRLKPTDGTIADIATGDTVRISGVKDGDRAAAERIVEGAGGGPGFGLGQGREKVPHGGQHGHGASPKK